MTTRATDWCSISRWRDRGRRGGKASVQAVWLSLVKQARTAAQPRRSSALRRATLRVDRVERLSVSRYSTANVRLRVPQQNEASEIP